MPQRPVKPPLSTVDVVMSIVMIVLIVACGVVGAAMGFMMLAFTDNCPPETCSIDGAVSALLGAFVIAVIVGVGGSIVTIVRLVRRQPAWPWALLTLVVCALIGLAGFAGYLAAVGG